MRNFKKHPMTLQELINHIEEVRDAATNDSKYEQAYAMTMLLITIDRIPSAIMRVLETDQRRKRA